LVSGKRMSHGRMVHVGGDYIGGRGACQTATGVRPAVRVRDVATQARAGHVLGWFPARQAG